MRGSGRPVTAIVLVESLKLSHLVQRNSSTTQLGRMMDTEYSSAPRTPEYGKADVQYRAEEAKGPGLLRPNRVAQEQHDCHPITNVKTCPITPQHSAH
jgi:hypothetical protein